MKLESVRDLKDFLYETIIKPMDSPIVARSAFGMSAQPMASAGAGGPTMALGVVRKAEHDYHLAVRIQRRGLENSAQLDAIKAKAGKEVDVRYIGRVVKLATPWHRKRTRPLKIGLSVGHFRITAGTLGGFVRGLDAKNERAVMILSNNHVLADENRARKGEAILQPGRLDGGQEPADTVATLTRFVRLKKTGANLVDAAVATLEEGTDFNARTLTGLGGPLAGVGASFLDEGMGVAKVGSTTGTTTGVVTAFELRNIRINYDTGVYQFDSLVEIEGDGTDPFSQGATAAR